MNVESPNMHSNDAGREDIMNEAVSLVKRVECRCPGHQELIVAGLNSHDWLFVYFGEDPMYRFDEQGRLRRAFVDGKLFRTEGRTLAIMDRQRDSEMDESAKRTETTLLRRDLSPEELDAFRVRVQSALKELHAGLVPGAITRQFPEHASSLLDEIRSAVEVALNSPEFLAPPLVRRSRP